MDLALLALSGLGALCFGMLQVLAQCMSSLSSDRVPFGVWLVLGGAAAMLLALVLWLWGLLA